MLNDNERHSIRYAMSMMLGQCDGARSRDDCGFNKLDTEWAHTYYNPESDAALAKAAKMLVKYHAQIGDTSEFARIAAREENEAATAPFVMTPSAERFKLDIAISYQRKDEAKAIAAHACGKNVLYFNNGGWHVDERWASVLIATGKFVAVDFTPKAPNTPAFAKPEAPAQPAVQIPRAETMAFSRPPRAFQIDAMNQLAPKVYEGGALLADDMGLGKTFTALGISRMLDKKLMVVCPASVRFNWVNEVFLNLPTATVHVLDNRMSEKARKSMYGKNIERFTAHPQDADVVIASYESCKGLTTNNTDPETAKYRTMKRTVSQEHLAWIAPRMFVGDEFHMAKNPKAQRTQNASAVCRACACKLPMTGTPIENRPGELWPILCAIGRNRAVAATSSDFYLRYIEGQDYKTLHQRLTSGGWYMRRMKRDVLKDLPPKRRADMLVEMPPAISKRYEAVAAKAQRKETTPAEQLVILTDLQTIANSAKVEPVYEAVEECLDMEKQVVISSTRVEPLQELALLLSAKGIPNALLIGGKSDSERAQIVSDFQSGGLKVVLTTLREGITLTAADTMFVIDFDWTPSKVLQREDRIYRIGQENPVTIIRVKAASIDSYKQEILDAKMAIIDAAINGRDTTNDDEHLGSEDEQSIVAAVFAKLKADQ